MKKAEEYFKHIEDETIRVKDAEDILRQAQADVIDSMVTEINESSIWTNWIEPEDVTQAAANLKWKLLENSGLDKPLK